jgi:hypothetical protein
VRFGITDDGRKGVKGGNGGKEGRGERRKEGRRENTFPFLVPSKSTTLKPCIRFVPSVSKRAFTSMAPCVGFCVKRWCTPSGRMDRKKGKVGKEKERGIKWLVKERYNGWNIQYFCNEWNIEGFVITNGYERIYLSIYLNICYMVYGI